MGVSIVVGGQYGSEGKGKVTQHLARSRSARAVVRVGGTNSGHTSLGGDGERRVLRQLPTAALDPDVLCVLAAGSYIDIGILIAEIERMALPAKRLVIDPGAMIITSADRDAEQASDLPERLGSTATGPGAAVARPTPPLSPRGPAAPPPPRPPAGAPGGPQPEREPYLAPVRPLLREMLDDGEHIVIEGTQGFGLSLLHSPHFPKATSRDTSAAAALAETGLSPLDVQDVVLVLRSFPIRVAGDSGPFGAPEITWQQIALEGGHQHPLDDNTSVTKKLRRVARFDSQIVREAIIANNPSMIVLNHLDYVDAAASGGM